MALPSPDPSFAEAAGRERRRFAVSPDDADRTLDVLTFPATGPVAIGCGRGDGLHVLTDGHVVELVDGELLVTPLGRKAAAPALRPRCPRRVGRGRVRLRERPAAPSRPAVSLLLSPLQVGSVEVRNRIAFTAHGSFLEFYRPGAPADRYVAYEERRARGGVGLIFLQTMHVHPSSHATGHYPYEPGRPAAEARCDGRRAPPARHARRPAAEPLRRPVPLRRPAGPRAALGPRRHGLRRGRGGAPDDRRRDRGGAGRVRRHGPGVRRGRARRRRAARHARLPAPAVLQSLGQPPRRRVGRAARVRQGARRAGARAHRAGAGRRAADLDRRLHGAGAGRPRPGGAPGGRARRWSTRAGSTTSASRRDRGRGTTRGRSAATATGSASSCRSRGRCAARSTGACPCSRRAGSTSRGSPSRRSRPATATSSR